MENKNTIYIFDTNFYLDLFRVSTSTAKVIINEIDKIKDNIYIPYQVLVEFDKHCSNLYKKDKYLEFYKEIKENSKTKNVKIDSVIKNNIKKDFLSIDDEDIRNLNHEISNKLSKYRSLKDEVESLIKRKCGLSKDELIKVKKEELNNIYQDIITLIDSNQKYNDKYNPIKENLLVKKKAIKIISEIKKSKMIRDSNLNSWLNEIYKLGKARYSQKPPSPPGYMDDPNINANSKKKGNDIYGDYVIWYEILEVCKETSNTTICFVTRDTAKGDWFLDDQETPRIELYNEFLAVNPTNTIKIFSTKDFFKRLNIDYSYLFELLCIQHIDKYLEKDSEKLEGKLEKYFNNYNFNNDIMHDNAVFKNEKLKRKLIKPVLCTSYTSNQKDKEIKYELDLELNFELEYHDTNVHYEVEGYIHSVSVIKFIYEEYGIKDEIIDDELLDISIEYIDIRDSSYFHKEMMKEFGGIQWDEDDCLYYDEYGEVHDNKMEHSKSEQG